MDKEVMTSISILKQIKDVTVAVTQQVRNLTQQVKNGDFDTSKGISLLEVKYQMLLSYLTNLSLLILKKSSGESIQGDSSILRLVEIRTVLEKIRPIDQKLKYQIDKLLKTLSTGTSDSSDPLRFKPNPENLISKLDDGDSGSDSEEEDGNKKQKSSKPKLYVPPKLAAVHYDGEETESERQQRQLETAKRRALSSSMIQDLQQQYSQAPTEIRESRDLHRLKDDKKTKERTEYEEDHFVRLSVSKKERAATKRLSTQSALDSLTHFDDISALGGSDGLKMGPTSKKRKTMGKKGKKSTKSKKRSSRGRKRH